MNYKAIIEKAADRVKKYFKANENTEIFYHNLTHTESVVSAVIEIARYYGLNEKDFFICVVAAWFHDIGYLEDRLNHEQIGAIKAEAFLINKGVDGGTVHA